MTQKRVLVACEYSGVVRDAFSRKGWNAWSCDLLPTESELTKREGKHIQGDVIPLLDQEWDLIIAHPPCTLLSKAGARWMYPQAGVLSEMRIREAIKARDFFMGFYRSRCPHLAIENPFPLKVVELPKWTQEIQPYEYGHPYSKKTCLWLRGLPELKPTNILSDHTPYLPSNTGGKARGQVYRYKSITPKESAKTFPGIANAMAEQWTDYLDRSCATSS